MNSPMTNQLVSLRARRWSARVLSILVVGVLSLPALNFTVARAGIGTSLAGPFALAGTVVAYGGESCGVDGC